MKKSIFLLLAINAYMFSHAQTENIYGGAGHFRFGYANHNLSSINKWLSDEYPALKNDFITVGGTGYAVRNNVVLGGEGFGSTGTTVSKDTIAIAPTMGRGMLNVGYILYDYHNFLVYPLFGFGGGGLTIRVRENQGFGSIVNRVKETDYSFSSSNLLLSLSVGADSYFITGERKKGFSVGVRAGYIYSLQNSGWKRNRTDIAGPNTNMSGFYIVVGIGGGHLNRK